MQPSCCSHMCCTHILRLQHTFLSEAGIDGLQLGLQLGRTILGCAGQLLAGAAQPLGSCCSTAGWRCPLSWPSRCQPCAWTEDICSAAAMPLASPAAGRLFDTADVLLQSSPVELLLHSGKAVCSMSAGSRLTTDSVTLCSAPPVMPPASPTLPSSSAFLGAPVQSPVTSATCHSPHKGPDVSPPHCHPTCRVPAAPLAHTSLSPPRGCPAALLEVFPRQP